MPDLTGHWCLRNVYQLFWRIMTFSWSLSSRESCFQYCKTAKRKNEAQVENKDPLEERCNSTVALLRFVVLSSKRFVGMVGDILWGLPQNLHLFNCGCVCDIKYGIGGDIHEALKLLNLGKGTVTNSPNKTSNMDQIGWYFFDYTTHLNSCSGWKLISVVSLSMKWLITNNYVSAANSVHLIWCKCQRYFDSIVIDRSCDEGVILWFVTIW
jgi:hypothetical protein